MAKEYAGSGNDDGVVMGRSGGKIGFFGVTTAVTQSTLTPAVATTAATTTTPYGWTTLAQANKVTKNLNEIVTALKACGIMG